MSERRGRGGGTLAPTLLDRLFNPISTSWADYAHHVTTCPRIFRPSAATEHDEVSKKSGGNKLSGARGRFKFPAKSKKKTPKWGPLKCSSTLLNKCAHCAWTETNRWWQTWTGTTDIVRYSEELLIHINRPTPIDL